MAIALGASVWLEAPREVMAALLGLQVVLLAALLRCTQAPARTTMTPGAVQAPVDCLTVIKIFDQLGDSVTLRSLDGIILIANQVAAAAVGRSPAEVMGKNAADLLDPDTAAAVQSLDRQVLASGQSVSTELRLQVKGSIHYLRRTLHPYYSPSGELAGLITIGRDVTEARTSAATETTRLTAVIKTQQAIATAGLDLDKLMRILVDRVSDMSAADGAFLAMQEVDVLVFKAVAGTSEEHLGTRLPLSTSLTGYCFTHGEQVYCRDTELDPRVDQEHVKRLGARSMIILPLVSAGTRVGVINAYAHRPGAFDDGHLHSLQLLVGLFSAAMSQAAEFALKNAAIASLQAAEKDLVLAREAAEKAAQVKTEFLASMSHEIRTPLNGVVGMTGLLLETPLDETQLKYARIVQDCSRGLMTIINDVLDFSKIEAGKMDLERLAFAPDAVLGQAYELMLPQAQAKGLKLEKYTDPLLPAVCMGDPGRISQVLLNLLSNAVKFTAAGTIMVEAKAQTLGVEGTVVEWRIKDSGIGLSEAEQQRLFLPFTQADSSTARRFGGTGLGLSISKRLIELMGGTIGVRSSKGAGSTFWFSLHLDHAAVDEHAATRHAAGLVTAQTFGLNKFGPRHVLIAEDNAVNQLLAMTLVKKLGFTTQAVANGSEAVAAVQSGHFDLILMDCQMPEMDGFEATRTIRAQEAAAGGGRLVIVALTANVMREDAEACYKSGMDGFLTKPVIRSQLEALLEQVLPPAAVKPAA